MKTRLRPWLDFLFAAVAVLAAVGVYFGWRNGLMLHWLLPGLSNSLQGCAAVFPLPSWVCNTLPDVLWQYAFAALVLGIWWDRAWGVRKVLFCAVPLSAGVGIELLQWVGVMPGTFDWSDVVGSALGTGLAFLLPGRLLDCVQRGLSSRALSSTVTSSTTPEEARGGR